MSADAFGVPRDQAAPRDVIVRADSQTYSLPRRADFESNLREASDPPLSLMRPLSARNSCSRIFEVINSSPNPVLNGEAWKLTLVFDTEAPETPSITIHLAPGQSGVSRSGSWRA